MDARDYYFNDASLPARRSDPAQTADGRWVVFNFPSDGDHEVYIFGGEGYRRLSAERLTSPVVVSISKRCAGIEGGVYYPQSCLQLRVYHVENCVEQGLSFEALIWSSQAPQTAEAADDDPAVGLPWGQSDHTSRFNLSLSGRPSGGQSNIMTHRLKLEPTFALEPGWLSLDIDAIMACFGNNAGLASTTLRVKLWASASGLETDSIALGALGLVPVGVMRVGRMPSNWCMGLLANGNGHDDLFGDNQNYTTYDQFSSQPTHQLLRRLWAEGSEIPLFIAVAMTISS